MAFLEYWRANREKEGTFASKLARGLPMSIIFALPIILSVVVVRVFFPDWYFKISSTSPGTFLTVILATIIIALFYAVFRMHHKWEINEQIYRELNKKSNHSTNQTSV